MTPQLRLSEHEMMTTTPLTLQSLGLDLPDYPAYSLEKGMSCHVIEAEHVGYGGSGRNTGLVNAAAWLPPQDVIKQLGAEDGKKFVDIFSDAPNFVFGSIKKYKIEREVTNTGTIRSTQQIRFCRFTIP